MTRDTKINIRQVKSRNVSNAICQGKGDVVSPRAFKGTYVPANNLILDLQLPLHYDRIISSVMNYLVL